MAMKSDSKLLIIEMIIPPGNEPSISKLLDLEMLVTTGGRERTKSEFENLLHSAGLKMTQVIPINENACIIEAIKKESRI